MRYGGQGGIKEETVASTTVPVTAGRLCTSVRSNGRTGEYLPSLARSRLDGYQNVSDSGRQRVLNPLPASGGKGSGGLQGTAAVCHFPLGRSSSNWYWRGRGPAWELGQVLTSPIQSSCETVTQKSQLSEGSEIIFTDDVCLQVLIEHLQELAAQD